MRGHFLKFIVQVNSKSKVIERKSSKIENRKEVLLTLDMSVAPSSFHSFSRVMCREFVNRLKRLVLW